MTCGQLWGHVLYSLNIRWLDLVNDLAIGSKKVTRGQLWGLLYRSILIYITHKDLSIDLMNIFQTNIVVGLFGIIVSYRHKVSHSAPQSRQRSDGFPAS